MVAALIVVGGVMGFDLIMRMQTVITVVTGVLTVVYIILVARPHQLGRRRRGPRRARPRSSSARWSS